MRAPKVREMGSRGARRLHSRRLDPRPPSARRFGLGHASPPVSASGPTAVDWPSFHVLVLFQYRIKDLCVNEIQLPKRNESSIWLTAIGINLGQLTIGICILSTYARAGGLSVTNLEKCVENFIDIWPSQTLSYTFRQQHLERIPHVRRQVRWREPVDDSRVALRMRPTLGHLRELQAELGRTPTPEERPTRTNIAPGGGPSHSRIDGRRGGTRRREPAPSSRSRSWPDSGATMGSRSWQPLQFQVPRWRPSSRPAPLFLLCPIFGISKVSVNFLHFRDCCFSESMVNHRSRWASPIRACANCAGRQRNKGWSK